ncbi:hypothetical protein G4B88_002204 [Cannabis sativa]|nr:hypothetical protein G4B88_002204 [Cannabis sativa]
MLVVGVMIMGCFGRLQPDVDLNLEPNVDRCMKPGEYCHIAQQKVCCGGLYCEGEWLWGENRYCAPIKNCIKIGASCNVMTRACCYPARCTSLSDKGTCQVFRNPLDDVQHSASSQNISTY